ncbi:G-patch-domain-containing protein [Backusella circina FSU 941]|nr:G-patch-domain-containing protein [Backusella circina FSU 941]
MGLAGQKEKQRISQDPNNLFWSKDESKFGFRMLQKMGWAPGKGLGVNEDGHKDHVKVRLKDNNLGVGATKKNIDNWLGNTDAFSRLLADLNSQPTSEASSINGDKKDKKEKKKDKKDKKEKKKDKKKKEESSDEEPAKPAAVVLRNAARAKFLRAKRMATSGDDKTHLNAILGVKSTVTKVADGSTATYMTAFTI